MSVIVVITFLCICLVLPCLTGGDLRQTWIDLCQKISVDPRELTNKKLDALLELILAASSMDAEVRFMYTRMVD